MTSTRGHLFVLGGNPLYGSDTLDSRMGVWSWDLSLGQSTGDGRFDRETFLGGLLIFFGGGYIVQWKFRYNMWQTIANDPPILDALGRQVCCSCFDNPST